MNPLKMNSRIADGRVTFSPHIDYGGVFLQPILLDGSHGAHLHGGLQAQESFLQGLVGAGILRFLGLCGALGSVAHSPPFSRGVWQSQEDRKKYLRLGLTFALFDAPLLFRKVIALRDAFG